MRVEGLIDLQEGGEILMMETPMGMEVLMKMRMAMGDSIEMVVQMAMVIGMGVMIQMEMENHPGEGRTS